MYQAACTAVTFLSGTEQRMNSAVNIADGKNMSRTVLSAEGLTRDFEVRRGFLGKSTLRALDGVSFDVKAQQTLAVVGESGCGKSTLARQLTMIDTPSAGRLLIHGVDPATADRATKANLRRAVQMVFQNPFASLNPRKTVLQTLSEPLITGSNLKQLERNDKVFESMRTVGLRPEHASRYPHMFSGGQRQRIAFARAIAMDPKIVVADEPVSALDVSIQAQILNLIMDLQDRLGTSYVFITHNLSVVRHVADEVMVMYLGRCVEIGKKDEVLNHPRHPYTRLLLASTPRLGRASGQQSAVIKARGELPSPLNVPKGCAFSTRCPHVLPRCVEFRPELLPVSGTSVACHRIDEI